MMKIKQVKIIALVLATFSITAVWDPLAIAANNMPGMDHGSKESVPMSPVITDDMSGMDQTISGSNNNVSVQGGATPADARDPNAYSDGYDFGPIPPPRMADEAYRSTLLVNRLERARSADSTINTYDLMGSFGKDYDKLVLKGEGEVDAGKLQDASTELLWGHALTAYWDTQLGVRVDSGVAPSRNWLAFGFQGIAPYWFDVEATAYVGNQRRSALRLVAEYELLLTQKLILQPRVEANFYGQQDAARELGSGLSDLVTGVRLRYEIRREFAPYIGVEWSGKFSGTADYSRAAGMQTKQTSLVAGVRFWF